MFGRAQGLEGKPQSKAPSTGQVGAQNSLAQRQIKEQPRVSAPTERPAKGMANLGKNRIRFLKKGMVGKKKNKLVT